MDDRVAQDGCKAEEKSREAVVAARCSHTGLCNGGKKLSTEEGAVAFASAKDCEACGKAYLNWICLECLEVVCGSTSRLKHKCRTISCQFASASVWCGACNRSLSKQEVHGCPALLSVMEAIHMVKFGHTLMLQESKATGACEVLNASATIEQKWQEFQDKFQRILDESVGIIGQALGAGPLPTICNLPEAERKAVLGGTPTLRRFADGIKSGRFKKIMVVTGAGISTSAGIPDFRSPVTGLYAQLDTHLKKYGLTRPEELFEIKYFRGNPAPFYDRLRVMWPGRYKPTRTHHFLRLLQDKNVLQRVYTQNIDGLEAMAGLRDDKLIQCHGGFNTARCIDCRKEVPASSVKESLDAGTHPTCAECGGYIKPDIVFYGESLSSGFAEHRAVDVAECDAVIVIGTSLTVAPTAHLPSQVRNTVPRLLLNREHVGDFTFGRLSYRDVGVLGDCDWGVTELAAALGWSDDLDTLCGKPYTAAEA